MSAGRRGRGALQALPALPRAQPVAEGQPAAAQRAPATRTSGRCATSRFEIPQGATFGLIGENGSRQVDAAQVPRQDPRPGRGDGRSPRAGSAALLELGSGFHPELSGRENVYLNGSILGMGREELDAQVRRDRRLLRHRALHRPAGEELLLRHVRAARLLRRDQRRPRRPARRRGPRGRGRGVPASCEERFADFRAAAAPSSWSATRCHPCGALRRGRLARPRAAARASARRSTSWTTTSARPTRTAWPTPDGGTARWGSGEVHGRAGRAARRRRPRGTGSAPATPSPSGCTTQHRSACRPGLRLAVETLDGVYLWAHNSRDGGLVPDAVEGVGHVDLARAAADAAARHLRPLGVDVTYDGPRRLDHRKALLRFDVSPGDAPGVGRVRRAGRHAGRSPPVAPPCASGGKPPRPPHPGRGRNVKSGRTSLRFGL